MAKNLTILGLPGSNRKDSFNASVLSYFSRLLPAGVEIRLSQAFYDLPLSYYEVGKTPPEAVKAFKKEIMSADGVLFSTPQYNYSFPTILKNILDWGGKPETQNVWKDKPGAVIGVCMDTLGTVEAVKDLREAMTKWGMLVLPDHDVLIGSVKDKFNAQGEITDPETKNKLRDLLDAFVKTIRK